MDCEATHIPPAAVNYPYSPQQRPLYGEFHRIADRAAAVTGRREVRSAVRP